MKALTYKSLQTKYDKDIQRKLASFVTKATQTVTAVKQSMDEESSEIIQNEISQKEEIKNLKKQLEEMKAQIELLKNEKRGIEPIISKRVKKCYIKFTKRCHYCKILGFHTSRSCQWKPPKSLLNDSVKILQWHKDNGTPEDVIKNSLISFDTWRNNFNPNRKKYVKNYFSKTVKNKEIEVLIPETKEQKVEENVQVEVEIIEEEIEKEEENVEVKQESDEEQTEHTEEKEEHKSLQKQLKKNIANDNNSDDDSEYVQTSD